MRSLLLLLHRLILRLMFILNLDLHEARHLCSANRAFVSLHPHYLRALNAQAHVSAWQHHRVFGCRIAYHTLSLRLIRDVSCAVIDSIDVAQIEYGVVVEELLLHEFELKCPWHLLQQLSVRYLHRLLRSSRVVRRVYRLNR